MINHAWSVLCSKSAIDRETNTLNLFDVIEQITGKDVNLPSTAPLPLELVSLWTRADLNRGARGQARLIVLEPNTNQREPKELSIDLTEFHRLRTRLRMGGFRITERGQYIFRVDLRVEGQDEWREVARVPLEVVLE